MRVASVYWLDRAGRDRDRLVCEIEGHLEAGTFGAIPVTGAS